MAGLECFLGSFWAGVGLTMIAVLVLWAGDGLELVTVGELADRTTKVQVPHRLGPVDISAVPIPNSVLSILKQIRHQNQGHEAFLCGEYGTTGWASYFPIAFLLKTPVGLIALLILASARVRPRGSWDMIAVGFLALLWVMLIRNKANIGVRYALLTYPLAIPFVARMLDGSLWKDRLWTPVVLASVAWFGWGTFQAGDRCLSYFNEIGGGPRDGWLYLADSNIDWGQDFDRTAQAIRDLGITEVTTDISSERRLALPGVTTVKNPPKVMQVPAITPPNRRLYDAEGGYLPVYTRYVAVSVSRLLGLYSQNDMSWLRSRRLVARVGDSVFIFDMDHPADRPLFDGFVPSPGGDWQPSGPSGSMRP